jgi:hypothetical protein
MVSLHFLEERRPDADSTRLSPAAIVEALGPPRRLSEG